MLQVRFPPPAAKFIKKLKSARMGTECTEENLSLCAAYE